MLHKGARTTGGNLSEEYRTQIDGVLDNFLEVIDLICKKRQFRLAVVRSRLPCSIVILLDSENFFLIGKNQDGMPSSIYIDFTQQVIPINQVVDIAHWDFAFEDPFIIKFPRILLKKDSPQFNPILDAIALSHIESEFQRMMKMTSLIPINPVFGPASYTVNENFVFILMPFDEELTKIYNEIIRPSVESQGFVCRRADDFKTNKIIIQDIWKAICESRFIIADLTDANPNVMYELGIAHTVGKETILINQIDRHKSIGFPFDITHIRRIEYENSAAGGKKLEIDLIATIQSLISPKSISK